MLQQTIAVFLVLGLLLAALWFLRQRGLASFNLAAASKRIGWRSNPARRMRIVERLALTPQHSLHLVSINNRLVVLAVYPNGCQVVDSAALHLTDRDADASLRNAAAC